MSKASEQQGQYLPISAQAEINGQMMQLEVAVTPQQKAMGLMFRPELPDDRGMLFLFDPPRPVQFWMRNVPVPLDMVFTLNGEVQGITLSAPPCTTVSCPVYGPDNLPVNQVIEMRSGRAAELGIEVGDRIVIRFQEPAVNSL
jgi:hypothetical protein